MKEAGPYLDWIIAGMKKPGKTRVGLARQLHVAHPQITKLLRGERRIRIDELPKIADYIEEPVPNFDHAVANDGVVPAREPVLAPVRGQVAAGLWFEEEALDEPRYDPVPVVPTRYAGLPQFAYRVVGDSMNEKGFVDGVYVIAVEYWKARAFPQSGDIVVVERREGQKTERTIKQCVVTPSEFRLEARSTNPKWAGTAITIDREGADLANDREVEIVGLVVGMFRPVEDL